METSSKTITTQKKCYVFDEDEISEILIEHCKEKLLPVDFKDAVATVTFDIYAEGMLRHASVSFELRTEEDE